jgi:hypothetical protein
MALSHDSGLKATRPSSLPLFMLYLTEYINVKDFILATSYILNLTGREDSFKLYNVIQSSLVR